MSDSDDAPVCLEPAVDDVKAHATNTPVPTVASKTAATRARVIAVSVPVAFVMVVAIFSRMDYRLLFAPPPDNPAASVMFKCAVYSLVLVALTTACIGIVMYRMFMARRPDMVALLWALLVALWSVVWTIIVFYLVVCLMTTHPVAGFIVEFLRMFDNAPVHAATSAPA